MGWLKQKLINLATEKQHKEMAAFVNGLRGADGEEIAMMLACATHIRHQLEAQRHNMLQPMAYAITNPYFPLLLSKTIASLQKNNRRMDAAGFMVWLHTARAAAAPLELRVLCRQMWKELERGFRHVDYTAMTLEDDLGIRLNIDGADTFPEGFTPDPS